MDYLINFIRDVIIWTAVGVLAYLLLFQWLRVVVGRTKFEADNIVLRIVRVPLIAAIIAYGFVSAFGELPLPPPVPLFVSNIYTVTIIASMIYLVWRIVKEVLLRWLTTRAGETESRVDDLILPLIGTVGPLVFFLIGLVSILQYLGVDVAVLATSIGILGLVIGLAFQDSLANLFSGIYLMIDPAFLENDLVRIDGDKVYSVEKVGLRMTRLYDMDSHASIFIPNSTIAKSNIANITKPTIDMKVKMRVTMPCVTDPARAGELLHTVVSSHRDTLDANETQLMILRARLEQLAPATTERGSTLAATMTALENWLVSDAGNDAAHSNLLAVRKEMSDRLAEAQAAIKRLVWHKHASEDIEKLRHALGHADSAPKQSEIQEVGHDRMSRIYKAFAAVKARFAADEGRRTEIAPLDTAINRLDELDRQEHDLEASIDQAEQSRENELDRLISTLIWTGDWVAEELISQGKPKEAARVSLWVRNIAVVYAFSEIEESLDGLDRELGRLIDWLHELEAGGLTKVERQRVRTLFGSWGGLRQMERRRVGELRRRVMRWVQLKEKDVLDKDEYARIVTSWERKLRLLSRRIPDAGTGDEETLDSSLVATRSWLRGTNFIEQLDDWKLPIVDLMGYDGEKLDYGLSFYIDDIKQQHFGREAAVKSAILADLYETCQREGLPIPVATLDEEQSKNKK